MCDTIRRAQTIYRESLGSLMAHTIRGVYNLFRQQHVELDLRVIPDTYGIIPLHAPTQGATSVILSDFAPRRHRLDRDRLHTAIYIHQHANKHLARACIAHEIYHLVLELDEFGRHADRSAWPQIPASREIEQACNHFAWELCRLHDKFNRNENLRKEHVLFPNGAFEQVFNMNDINGWDVNWPDGFALDPTKPFYKHHPE